ncbi:hypothetical protein F6X42_43185 [Paraburkholderia sp. WC7.3b]|uniref:Alanine racemase C-terminal domain-containing protein n=1 Tax=Paraburkholderia podalyriae TaxID=1938811 RepID=A0ABR7Q3A0_9BURK|nr:hypothetical protein [Paraburkholderia podalyriae]
MNPCAPRAYSGTRTRDRRPKSASSASEQLTRESTRAPRLYAYVTVELTPCPSVGIGSKIRALGEQVKIDDVASAAGTIGYKLMCALALRVPVTVPSFIRLIRTD